MIRKILAISGKPGLYKLISRGNKSLIVETVDEQKKRIPVSALTALYLSATFPSTPTTTAKCLSLLSSSPSRPTTEKSLSTSLPRRHHRTRSSLSSPRCSPTTTPTVYVSLTCARFSLGTTSSLLTAILNL